MYGNGSQLIVYMPYSILVIWHIVLTGRQSSRRTASKTDPYMCVAHSTTNGQAQQDDRKSRKLKSDRPGIYEMYPLNLSPKADIHTEKQ